MTPLQSQPLRYKSLAKLHIFLESANRLNIFVMSDKHLNTSQQFLFFIYLLPPNNNNKKVTIAVPPPISNPLRKLSSIFTFSLLFSHPLALVLT